MAVTPRGFARENLASSWQEDGSIVVAGRGSLDEPSAAMLAQLLQKPWHWCASAAVRRSFGSLPVGCLQCPPSHACAQ